MPMAIFLRLRDGCSRILARRRSFFSFFVSTWSLSTPLFLLLWVALEPYVTFLARSLRFFSLFELTVAALPLRITFSQFQFCFFYYFLKSPGPCSSRSPPKDTPSARTYARLSSFFPPHTPNPVPTIPHEHPPRRI